MTSEKCAARNPLTCKYHGVKGLLNVEYLALQKVQTDPKNLVALTEYYTARQEREKYEALGGDEILLKNGVVTKSDHTPTHIRALTNLLSPQLPSLAGLYHFNDFSRKQIKDTDAELLIVKALKNKGIPLVYDEGSHKIGSDIFLTGNKSFVSDVKDYGISVKSGSINAKGKVSLSNSRTTSYLTIEDKIRALESNHSDAYVCFSSVNTTKTTRKPGIAEYRVLVFSGDLIDFGTPEDWEETDKKWVKKNLKGPISQFEIRKSQSDQLWFTLDTTSPDFHGDSINISVKSRD